MPKHTEYVAGFMFDPSLTRVALIRKTKPEWQKGNLNAIGGKIEDSDESAAHAMQREFFEETGMPTLRGQWQEFVVLTLEHGRVHFFHTIGDVSQVRTTTEEEVSIELVTMIPRLPVIPNLRWLVPLALESSLILPLRLVENF